MSKSSVLAIIIPTLNEERYLEPLVENVAAQAKRLNAEIIIVDGGSSDSTVAIAQALCERNETVTLKNNPLTLQAAALNLAVSQSPEAIDMFIRIDAHASYPSNYCEILVQEAFATNADSVVVALKAVGISGFQKAVAAAQNSKMGNGGSAHRSTSSVGRWVDHGHHALMRVLPFKGVGGYDVSFSHNEDAELDFRLKEAGYKIWLTNKTTVEYFPRASPARLFSQYFLYGNGRASTLLKHKSPPKIRQIIPALFMPLILFSFLSVLIPFAWLPALIWIFFACAYGCLLSVQQRDKWVALSGPAALIMHAAWSAGVWRRALRAWAECK